MRLEKGLKREKGEVEEEAEKRKRGEAVGGVENDELGR